MTIRAENYKAFSTGYVNHSPSTKDLQPPQQEHIVTSLTSLATVALEGKQRSDFINATYMGIEMTKQVDIVPEGETTSPRRTAINAMVTGGISQKTAQQIPTSFLKMLAEAHFRIEDITTFEGFIAARKATGTESRARRIKLRDFRRGS